MHFIVKLLKDNCLPKDKHIVSEMNKEKRDRLVDNIECGVLHSKMTQKYLFIFIILNLILLQKEITLYKILNVVKYLY